METVFWWEPCEPHTHPLTAPPMGLVQPETILGKASIQLMQFTEISVLGQRGAGKGQSRSGWANETCPEAYCVCVCVCVFVYVCVRVCMYERKCGEDNIALCESVG